MQFKKTSFEEHPEGPCIGTFVEWTEVDGQFGPQIQAKFDTNEDMADGRPFRISFYFGGSLNPKSNAYKFFKGMGFDVDNWDDDANVDLDDLIGRKVNLMVEMVRGNDGNLRSKITSMTAIKRGKPQERELVGAGASSASRPASQRPDMGNDE